MLAYYCSPHVTADEWANWLNCLAKVVRGAGCRVVTVGDFNGKFPLWGETKSNISGTTISEAIAFLDLEMGKVGSTHTFPRQNASSLINQKLMLCCLLRNVVGWRVNDPTESMSEQDYRV